MHIFGTAGLPKGVVIKHSDLIAAIGAVNTLVWSPPRHVSRFHSESLARILEYVVELCLLFIGICSCYGRVKTLMDPSVRNCKGVSRDQGCPAVWDLICKGILSQVNNSGPFCKNMFNGAMSVRKANILAVKNVVQSLIFSKIKQATGGCLGVRA